MDHGTTSVTGSALLELKGVGPVSAARLAAAGFTDMRRLAFAFPHRFRDVRFLERPGEDSLGSEVALLGRCQRAFGRRLRGRLNLALVKFDVLDRTHEEQEVVVEAAFFGQSYLARQLPPGRVAVFSGVLEQRGRGVLSLRAPRISFDVAGFSPGRRREPVYPSVEGVPAQRFRKLVHQAVERVLPELREELPTEVLARLDLVPLPDAVALLHDPPEDGWRLERARRRLAFSEARELLASVRQRRARRQSLASWSVGVTEEIDRRIRSRLPFQLSAEQETCVASLRRDLAKGMPMARLLQGDVGTGKTLVAVYGCLAVAAAGLKAVLLAPTEFLAEQHGSRLAQWLAGSTLPVVQLTSSSTANERAQAAAALRSQEPCVVVGTHALLVEGVEIARVGLLVIDEQHRFGVAQRGRLFRRTAGRVPHVLVMSATPIPRTLATALFGDLDCSEIRHPPVPRPPVRTRVLDKRMWPKVVERCVREAERGGRIFVVCPRIGDDDEADDSSALATFAELKDRLPTVLVHGRQTPAERRRAQADFVGGRATCLVGTTVVEVGIDVPQATWMVVRDAERLGLCSLHQLRGRVGRGGQRALCLVLGEESCTRLTELGRCSDGFTLAEADLKARGAGELTGRMQHGHGRFRCLDPFRDFDLLRAAGFDDHGDDSSSSLRARSGGRD